MKKIYLLFTILSIGLGFSQTILNQSETTSRTVQDPQTVIMLPGFHATSATVNPFVAKIGTTSSEGETPIDSNAGSGNPSGTIGSNSFHDTQGNIEVNGGGQLQFTLPIALPPGVKSVAPQVNLVYTSGSGNGIAGYGWNLSGITSISRMGRTIEKDGEVRGIQLDYSDYYSFNGQRLILKSGEYGKDGAEYVTEKYSNVKIKSVGRAFNLSQPLDAPNYFEVTFEDGSQAWYGLTPDGLSYNASARTPMEYNIVKWKDAQGNYITYNYTQNNNVAVITSIQWGGNETLDTPHFNQIVFNYVARDLKETSYVNGMQFIQDKLLSNVVVKANDTQFKKYVVTYNKDIVNNDTNQTINYQFVKSIQEFNSQNEPANPVTFTTKPLIISTQEKSFGDFNNVITTGDYNGDGLVDFVVDQPAQNGKPDGYYVYFNAINDSNPSFVYLGAGNNFFSSRLITFNIKPSNGYIKPKQGLLIIENPNSNPPATRDIELKYYNINNDASVLNTYNNPLVLEYSKTIFATEYEYDDALYPITIPPVEDDDITYGKKSVLTSAKEVDIDSDGLSELIFSVADSKCYKHIIVPDPLKFIWRCNKLGYRHIVINNDDIDNNTYHVIAPINKDILGKGGIMDFDNDGKQDIMFIEPNVGNVNVSFYTKEVIGGAVSQKNLSVQSNNISQYSLTKTNNTYNISLKNTFNVKGIDKYILFADLNGDKNMEILAPLEKGDYYSTRDMGWSINLNNGKNLSESYQGLILFRDDSAFTYYSLANDYPAAFDIDNDGKSELVMFCNAYSSYYNHSNVGIVNLREFQYNPNDPQFKWSYKRYYNYNVTIGGQGLYPIYGDFRFNNSNAKILLISKSTNAANRKVISFQNYNINIDKNISAISQGNLSTEIDYKELDPNVNPNFYAPVKQEQYPYVELDKVSQSYAVSQLRQTIPVNGINKVRKQDFRYRGFITHLQGKSMIGFRQTARSTWYTDEFINTKIWSGAEIDPINEGLPIKEWSIKTNDESQIFPTDISETNTQLLSFKSTQYRIDKLLNGTVVDAGTVSTADKPNLVTAIVPVQSKTKDFQKDITTVNTLEYGSYYLPSKTTSDINNGFAVSTTELKYIHNISGTGKDYYVGRPESKTELRQVYGDSKGAKEEYTYENNLLKTTKTYNRNNSGWLQDTYLYDGFGNITEKQTSNSLDSKTKTARTTYEDKGRFVIKKTDVDFNLETHITYNDWGQVLTQTDPLGNTLTNTYDGWGKLLTAKTNLGGTTTYTYEKESNGDTKVTEYSPDGNQKIAYTNKIGQKYRVTTKGLTEYNFVSQDVMFDALGRKIKESEPGITGVGYYQWNTIEYDDYSRPIKAVAFTGKTMETSYSGRTVTITEKNTKQSYTNLPASGVKDKFKTQVEDAVGNIISTTDIGGTIEFKYNAAGENTEAKYGTNVVTTKYDSWGRKIEFNDPSNGLYQYEYNDGFGNLTKEISPKGYKEYTFNNLGQLITQREVSNDGTSTNKTIQFEYNTKGAIVKKYGTANGKSYSSYVNYDKYGRVISSGEESNGKYYMKKGITYDDKSRVISYEKSLVSSGILTKTTIENVYSTWSGELYQLKDQTSGKILWQLDEANAKGLVLKAKLGGTSIENTYDNSNFLSSVSHINTVTNATVLQLGYSFNAVRNELNSRTRGGDFNINEVFAYDDNNRLVNWTNPVTGQLSNNVYDAQGRIIENDQLGVIKYEDPAKIYQATGMTLNAAGTNNYNNNLIQRVSYNENNDPIYIDGEKGDVAFEYGLTEMRQMVHYGGNFQPPTGNQASNSKYTKYYSEDGSYEIIRNNQTGEEKHLLYIGGTPYESNIVYLKNFSEAQTKYVFLHKDYLGSILAISDEAGNALEQRHYDAWGNFTHLKVGVNEVITDNQQLSTINLLIDRGYTSHEHFNEVGIIHMNGRLYDPLLRRFLNADENIQDPHNTQNYNKYGYVMNNPLMYNDPNGEFLWIPFLIAVAKAAAIGAGIGLASYTLGLAITGNLSKWNIGGALKSVLYGAISGAITFGIGTIFSSSSGIFVEIGKGLLHGFSQGILSYVQGENFAVGFFSAALGSLGAYGYGKAFKDFAYKKAGQILFGIISGGVGAELTGGNFWQGAIVGGVVAGLNHAMHAMDEGTLDQEDPKQQTPGNKYGTLEEYRAWRDYPGYHAGETKMDRIFRLMNSVHIEIMADEGAGGGMMYGGFGRGVSSASKLLATEKQLEAIAKNTTRVARNAVNFEFRSDISASKMWNLMKNASGVTNTKQGFISPNGVKWSMYGGGKTNPNGYNIKGLMPNGQHIMMRFTH